MSFNVSFKNNNSRCIVFTIKLSIMQISLAEGRKYFHLVTLLAQCPNHIFQIPIYSKCWNRTISVIYLNDHQTWQEISSKA